MVMYGTNYKIDKLLFVLPGIKEVIKSSKEQKEKDKQKQKLLKENGANSL
jgi:hypothetical protein